MVNLSALKSFWPCVINASLPENGIAIALLTKDYLKTELSFEFCSQEYDELDYETLANKLNVLIDFYKTQLKARAGRRISGKDVGKEAPIAEPS